MVTQLTNQYLKMISTYEKEAELKLLSGNTPRLELDSHPDLITTIKLDLDLDKHEHIHFQKRFLKVYLYL